MLDTGGGFSGLPVWSVGAVGPCALCPLLIVAMVSAAKRPKLWNSGVYRELQIYGWLLRLSSEHGSIAHVGNDGGTPG